VPLFLPAIYEHKAWFIGSTPSAIARDANLLTRALLANQGVAGAAGFVPLAGEVDQVGGRRGRHRGAGVVS